MANFGSGFIIIRKSWNDMKFIVSSKKLNMQYDESSGTYEIFAVDSQIVYLCVIFIGEIVGADIATQEQNDIEKADFEANYLSKCNEPSYSVDWIRNRMVEVNYRFDNAEDGDIFLLVDLSNPDGYFHHSDGYGIKLGAITSFSNKTNMDEAWEVRCGIVLDVDTEKAKVGWIRPGTTSMRSSGVNQYEYIDFVFPLVVDCTVNNKDFAAITSNHIEFVYNLNTTTPIKDTKSVDRTPGIGDLILRTKKLSGDGGTVMFDYHLWYFVE